MPHAAPQLHCLTVEAWCIDVQSVRLLLQLIIFRLIVSVLSDFRFGSVKSGVKCFE